MKVLVKRAFKSYILSPKINEKVDRLCMKFLQLPIQVWRGAHILYFKIKAPIFWCPLFFEEYLKPQVRINKMVNNYTVDYQPSLSGLTSRIQPAIFIWTPSMGGKNFQIYRVKITGKCICESKFEYVQF